MLCFATMKHLVRKCIMHILDACLPPNLQIIPLRIRVCKYRMRPSGRWDNQNKAQNKPRFLRFERTRSMWTNDRDTDDGVVAAPSNTNVRLDVFLSAAREICI